MSWFTKKNILLRFLIGGLVLVLLTCLGLYWDMTRRPYYVELDIPTPTSHLPHGDWSFTQYSTQVWTDSGTRYFIVRQETIVFNNSLDPEYGFRSWDEVISYFETYLSEAGWVRETAFGYAPCNPVLTETNFLPEGPNGYLAYIRTANLEANKWTQPVVCLAVWPHAEDEEGVSSFNVVLLSANPSSWAEWLSEF